MTLISNLKDVKLIFHGASTPIEYCENWKELCFKLNPELDPEIPDSAFDLLSKWLTIFFFFSLLRLMFFK